MNYMKNYLKLARVKHYLKNVLIFIPLFFSGMAFENANFLTAVLGFVTFSLICSVVYILNDLKDIKKDQLHEIKKNRPIASGKISKKNAIIFAVILVVAAILIEIFGVGLSNYNYIFLLIYLVINLGYSLGLKDIPILDVVILVSGFVLRIIYGAAIFGITVSNWLYLTIISISFYLSLGKRRNEIIKSNNSTRSVLKNYSKDFLDKNMYVFLTTSIVFYSLWCVDFKIVEGYKNLMFWTIPLVIIIFLKYSMIVETDSHGDPMDVILSDRTLIFLGLIYIMFLSTILYLV